MPLTDEVLLIDDDPSEFAFISAALKALGRDCTLTYRTDGESGLSRASAAAPQVILLDLSMPGMSGFDVLDALASDTSRDGAPVVVVSDSPRNEDRDKAIGKGAAGYFVKPVTPKGYSDMICAIERLVG